MMNGCQVIFLQLNQNSIQQIAICMKNIFIRNTLLEWYMTGGIYSIRNKGDKGKKGRDNRVAGMVE